MIKKLIPDDLDKEKEEMKEQDEQVQAADNIDEKRFRRKTENDADDAE